MYKIVQLKHKRWKLKFEGASVFFGQNTTQRQSVRNVLRETLVISWSVFSDKSTCLIYTKQRCIHRESVLLGEFFKICSRDNKLHLQIDFSLPIYELCSTFYYRAWRMQLYFLIFSFSLFLSTIMFAFESDDKEVTQYKKLLTFICVRLIYQLFLRMNTIFK